MKKTLLSIAALAATALTGMADEYTLVFDGNEDLFGLKRQPTIKADELEFVPEIKFSEAGIDCSITNTAETGSGFALVDAGGTNSGVYVYSGMKAETFMDPEITLTVPNGKITGAKLYLTGVSLLTLEIDFNGKMIESEKQGDLFCWSWNDAEGPETLTMKWQNKFSARYIHSIELTYTPDLGGKLESGISFAQTSYEAIIGENFTSPKLLNPNNLSIAWTSSDEKVATVDETGNVTLVGGGKTVIMAATEGNEEFAAGNAKYELAVIPSASNIKELLEYAPNVYDRVKVNFPATVAFCSLSTVFVTDSENNAACFDDIRNKNNTSASTTNMYKVGQVIPAGWIATNATMYESVIWEGIPAKPTETAEVTYEKVESVTPADADRVVTLMNVKFESRTAEGNTKAFGTTPDGTRYEFQDTYNTASKPAGTYDVTGVVRYSKRGSSEYFFIAPISYAESSTTAAEITEADGAGARYYNLQGAEVANPQAGTYVKVINGKGTKVIKK